MSDLKNYLKKVALNIIRDRLRRQKTRTRVDFDEVNRQYTADEDFADTVLERCRIEEALNKLTNDQRTVLEYRILKGYSVRETALIMDKTENAVKVMQYRAVKAMHKIMNETE